MIFVSYKQGGLKPIYIKEKAKAVLYVLTIADSEDECKVHHELRYRPAKLGNSRVLLLRVRSLRAFYIR